MYSPEPEDVYRAARVYLPNLPENMRSLLEELLNLAKTGQKVDNQIIDLMVDDDQARTWMRAALFTESTRGLLKGYDQLGGAQNPIQARDWVCPKVPKGHFKWHIYRVGQPVPPCPIDESVLVPVAVKKKRKKN